MTMSGADSALGMEHEKDVHATQRATLYAEAAGEKFSGKDKDVHNQGHDESFEHEEKARNTSDAGSKH
eukprot:CAMPEP_0174908820 /NCGR_PEP_ID=MMETSP0167-20121228/65898_1 /TAXON_ID=38298 /ORGANISM="Rhodella maculata, Strain CCMP736" /LENGTH=67 /DNA_ID=CAMNT_0016152659 /DNA_START=101 /DNA_END=304 /DNA_ORIENTATION=+